MRRQSTVRGARMQGAMQMDLWTWLPGLFALGIFSILVCLAYTEGCGRI
jgi:hypothetical protein